jgi:sulfate transport system ATP-binding protein
MPTDAKAGPAQLYFRPHDVQVVDPDAGLTARVSRIHRLADRVTVELWLQDQDRPVEVDLGANPGIAIPEPGSTVGLDVLRWRVFADGARQGG